VLEVAAVDVLHAVRPVEREPADGAGDVAMPVQDAVPTARKIALRLPAAAPRHVSPAMYAARSLSTFTATSAPNASWSSSRSG